MAADLPSDLAGLVAVITGAASGIGAATASLLAARGASVVIADLDGDAAEAHAASLRQDGHEAMATRTDATSPADLAAMVAAAVGTFGGLDLAVNNAGTSGVPSGLLSCTAEQWAATLDLNLTGLFHALRAEVPAILARGGGAIVNVASMAGLMGFSALPAYAASKHGVIGLTRSVAMEYVRQNLRVNAVCPANTKTAMLESFIAADPSIEKLMLRGAPMGRLAEPAEIASAIAWLLSPAASYVNGIALPIDSGAAAGA